MKRFLENCFAFVLVFAGLFLGCARMAAQENVYFVDGFHGGVYGHYPMQTYTDYMCDLLEKYPKWSMCLEIEPETWDTVKVKTPDAYRRFAVLAGSDRVEFTNPAYAQPYMYNISGESIIRQIGYGIRKINSHFPDVRFSTYAVEEPCFTSALPQILRQFGFQYASLKCPDTCWGGYSAPYGGELVNWTGPDGTSILTSPRYACEDLQDGTVWQTAAWGNKDEYIDACRKAGIRNIVGMCYQDAGWTYGPWIGYGENVRNGSEYVTWREYFEEKTAGKSDDDYVFSQEEVRPALMWGSSVLRTIARQVRHSENNLEQAEKAGAIAYLENGFRYDESVIDEAWRTLMLAQHHDSWIVPYNGLNRRGTWADNIALWTASSDAACDEIIGNAISSFDGAASGDGKKYVTVLNTNGTARSSIARVALDGLESDCGNVVVLDVEGKAVPAVIDFSQAVPQLSFVADVPAFGYATFSLEPASGSQAGCHAIYEDIPEICNGGEAVVENELYRIVFDASKGGVIKSLVDKKANKEYVDHAVGAGINELKGFFYEEGIWHSSADVPAVIEVRNNGLEQTATIKGKIASAPFVQTVTLRKGDRKIDFSLEIDWDHDYGIGEYAQNDAYGSRRRAFYNDRYKLNVLFPVALNAPRLYKDAPFDVCKSRLDDTCYETWDNIKHNVILHWTDLSEGRDGNAVALFTDHTTSYSYGPDCPLSLTVQFSGNGLWGRDYRITGPAEMNYSLLPHTGEWDNAGIAQESEAWNEPLLCSLTADSGVASASFVDLEGTGYELSAAYMTDEGLLLRLFNSSDDDSSCKVALGFDVESVTEVDLNGNDIKDCPVSAENGKMVMAVSMPRFGIRTYLVRLAEELPLSSYVNPFIGASTSVGDAGVYHGLGKTFPGATVPYGMVQVSPNTITGGDNGSGYSYEMKTIEGFAFTQMSGVGWFGDLGNFLVMPTCGPLSTIAGKEDGSIAGWRSEYDKETEESKAGYYRAELSRYGIVAECTAALHSGALRFTFPQHDCSRIQIDLARRVGGTSESQYVEVIDDSTIAGWMKCTPQTGGWGNGDGKADYTVYFYAKFSRPMENYGFWSADIPDGWARKKDEAVSLPYLERVSQAEIVRGYKRIEGRHIGFFTEFPTSEGEQVTLKAGISFVDMDGARNNYMSEIAGKDFDDIRSEASGAWDRELGRIKVEGGTAEDRTVFYTALYHSMIDPRIYTDVDGRYVGGDYKVHNTDGKFTKRTIFSGWDTFRSLMPLQTIINPALVSDLLNSLITMADQSGREYFERWEFLNSYSGCMIGNPALSVLTDAYVKGIRTYDVDKAYKFAVNSSEKFGNFPLGWSPAGLCISETLEYAYFDWCISQLAAQLGKTDDAKRFARQSMAYRNIFDRKKGWFRPRLQDGSWEAWPENARTTEWYGCIECNPYQQGWFVPHDITGMVKLMGGKKKVISDLDNFFENTPSNMLWNQYYNHANEPVHFVPFLFNRLGQPWKTQKWTRFICSHAYSDGVNGLVGNDDAGQMSAWYVLAASGIHPVCPGSTGMEITSPVFDRIEFALDPDYTAGGTFTVIAHDNSPENIYIQKAVLDGKPLEDFHIDFSDIVSGSTLELYMGNVPAAGR